jgi:hypothetical protein
VGRSRTIKQLNIAVVVGVLAGLGTLMWVPGAGAYLRASGSERAAIDRTVRDWWYQQRHACLGSDRLVFRAALVSSIDRRYAEAVTDDNSCTYSFGYFVRRPRRVGDNWKVIGASSDNAQKCSYYASFLPRKVMAEFKVTGVRKSSGPLVRCVPTRS